MGYGIEVGHGDYWLDVSGGAEGDSLRGSSSRESRSARGAEAPERRRWRGIRCTSARTCLQFGNTVGWWVGTMIGSSLFRWGFAWQIKCMCACLSSLPSLTVVPLSLYPITSLSLSMSCPNEFRSLAWTFPFTAVLVHDVVLLEKKLWIAIINFPFLWHCRNPSVRLIPRIG